MAVGSSEAMSIQSASKPKNARAIATGPASTATEISLLDRLSILASILLTLKQSTTGGGGRDVSVRRSQLATMRRSRRA